MFFLSPISHIYYNYIHSYRVVYRHIDDDIYLLWPWYNFVVPCSKKAPCMELYESERGGQGRSELVFSSAWESSSVLVWPIITATNKSGVNPINGLPCKRTKTTWLMRGQETTEITQSVSKIQLRLGSHTMSAPPKFGGIPINSLSANTDSTRHSANRG